MSGSFGGRKEVRKADESTVRELSERWSNIPLKMLPATPLFPFSIMRSGESGFWDTLPFAVT
jgi:hypothetical protein